MTRRVGGLTEPVAAFQTLQQFQSLSRPEAGTRVQFNRMTHVDRANRLGGPAQKAAGQIAYWNCLAAVVRRVRHVLIFRTMR
jgi:hypothetical protein